MRSIDRSEFSSKSPYIDKPQYIGFGTTISAPHMHAHALEILQPVLKKGNTCLDIGCGSGYLTLCMALLVGNSGKVYGIDHMKELVDLSIKNISKSHSKLVKNKNIVIIHKDGRSGYSSGGPYDCIHVGAASSVNVANLLCKQLKIGGKLVMPVEISQDQQIYRLYVKKFNNEIQYTDLLKVLFGKLKDENEQRELIKYYNR